MNMREIYTLPLDAVFEIVLVTSPCNKRNDNQIDIRKRVDRIQWEAVKQFNCEDFIITFDMRQNHNDMNSHYALSSCYDPLTETQEHQVRAYGDKYTYSFLFSILHELGHAIDYRNRSWKTASRQGKQNDLRCERNAWLEGIKWGMENGFLTREEVEKHYPEMIVCLGSYYMYYNMPFEDFDRAQQKIYKKLMK